MRHSGLPLAIAGSYASTHTLPEHRRAQNADHLAHNTPFSAFFTKVVCDLGATPPQVAASPSPIGGIALHEPPTRRRHAARRLRVVETPTTAGVEGTGGAGGQGRLRDAGLAAAPVGGGRAWPGFEATHNRASTAGAEGTGRTRGLRCQAAAPVGGRQGLAWLRGYAPSEARGADDSRAGRRPRARQAARPGTTARGPLHPLRADAPDQKGCTAYGSAAAPRITRTNAESARRAPTISQASSMIGPKATTATKAHNVWTRGYDTAPGACIKQRPPRGIHYQW